MRPSKQKSERILRDAPETGLVANASWVIECDKLRFIRELGEKRGSDVVRANAEPFLKRGVDELAMSGSDVVAVGRIGRTPGHASEPVREREIFRDAVPSSSQKCSRTV